LWLEKYGRESARITGNLRIILFAACKFLDECSGCDSMTLCQGRSLRNSISINCVNE
jgi:hypothetical protein